MARISTFITILPFYHSLVTTESNGFHVPPSHPLELAPLVLPSGWASKGLVECCRIGHEMPMMQYRSRFLSRKKKKTRRRGPGKLDQQVREYSASRQQGRR